MTGIDQLKQVARAITMEGEAQEITLAIHQLMMTENISPWIMIRALQLTLSDTMGLSMAHKTDDRFEDMLDALCAAIRSHATRIRKAEIERRAGRKG